MENIHSVRINVTACLLTLRRGLMTAQRFIQTEDIFEKSG